MRLTACALLTLSATPAVASSDPAWEDLRDRACAKAASELRNNEITSSADTFQSVTVSPSKTYIGPNT